MPAEIPGYYYDASANRYFKIQANHIAPAGANYSRQAVNAQRAIEETVRREEASRWTKNAATVSRSSILQHPLFSFERRLGDLHKGAGSIVAEYYAAGLTGQSAVCTRRRGKQGSVTEDWRPTFSQKFTIGSSGELIASIDNIHQLYRRRRGDHGARERVHAVEYAGGVVVLPRSSCPKVPRRLNRRTPLALGLDSDGDGDDDDDGAWPDVGYDEHDERRASGYLYDYNHHQIIHNPSPGADCLVPAGAGAVVWTRRNPGSETSHLTRTRYVAEQDVGPAARRASFEPPLVASITYAVPFHVLDMAASPTQRMAAMATSDGLALSLIPETADELVKGFFMTGVVGEQMSVTFKDENTIITGTRSGRVTLCDVRDRALESGSASVMRIQHSSAISGLAALPQDGGGHRVLVNGLQDMKMYDLRFAPSPSSETSSSSPSRRRKSPSRSRSRSKSKHRRHQHHRRQRHERGNSTPPCLTFNVPPSRAQNRYGLGFAYDPELNVVLRASTDDVANHRVGIWSASTGQLLPGPLNDRQFRAPVTCIDVSRIRDGPKSILLATGGDIVEWTPQGRGGPDDV